MLATLDPLGLPLVCQPVAGNYADDGLYVAAYEAATAALGTTQVLVVGDSKMGALATRGHLVAGQSAYLCAYRPPSATEELTRWREQALTRATTWQTLATVDPKTGEILKEVVIDERERTQTWTHPLTQECHTWTERVLVARSSAYQAGLRQRRARALARLTEDLVKLWQPPGRGRKCYHSRESLVQTVAAWVAQAGLTGVVQTRVAEETLPDGSTQLDRGRGLGEPGGVAGPGGAAGLAGVRHQHHHSAVYRPHARGLVSSARHRRAGFQPLEDAQSAHSPGLSARRDPHCGC
jgi:hypothetical protein